MPKKLINPAQLFDGTAFRMSQAVVDSESSLLFASGHVDWDLQHRVQRDTVSDQLQEPLDNLRTVLTEAGAKVEDLLHMRIYIRGELEDYVEAIRPTVVKCQLTGGCPHGKRLPGWWWQDTRPPTVPHGTYAR